MFRTVSVRSYSLRLLKAGAVAEKLGQNEKALGFYELIKDQYPQAVEAYDIDKYIGRIENK